jgi:hypothetical protein
MDRNSKLLENGKPEYPGGKFPVSPFGGSGQHAPTRGHARTAGRAAIAMCAGPLRLPEANDID